MNKRHADNLKIALLGLEALNFIDYESYIMSFDFESYTLTDISNLYKRINCCIVNNASDQIKAILLEYNPRYAKLEAFE
jgi:hypothetical protein